MEKNNKWILLENYEIFYGGLWVKTDPSNGLSEMIEVPGLEYLGLEDGSHLYKCEQPPLDVLNLVKENIGDDTHVYLCIDADDKEGQRVYLWAY